MANPAAVPFHFDLDLGGAPSRRTDSPATRAALDDAFARGEAAGRAAAEASTAAALASALAALGTKLAVAEEAAAARALARDAQTVRLALAIGGKLAGAALERFPLAAIERLATACLAEARGAPHLAVRVHDSLVEEVETRLRTLAAERGFSGRLVVLGDPAVPRGDGRLEWADGGMARDRAVLAATIEAALLGQIAAPTAPDATA